MKRHIAVIQIPRAQVSRLGTISSQDWSAGPNTTSLNAWTPLQDLARTLSRNYSSMSSDSWQAELLRRQSQASETTPGTLSYTPAPSDPSSATVTPPWARWSTSACDPTSGGILSMGTPSPAAAAASVLAARQAAARPSSTNGWLIVAGILGATASLMYLKQSSKGNR